MGGRATGNPRVGNELPFFVADNTPRSISLCRFDTLVRESTDDTLAPLRKTGRSSSPPISSSPICVDRSLSTSSSLVRGAASDTQRSRLLAACPGLSLLADGSPSPRLIRNEACSHHREYSISIRFTACDIFSSASVDGELSIPCTMVGVGGGDVEREMRWRYWN